MDENRANQTSPFDSIRQWKDGFEFWSARDLQKFLGYENWHEFEEAIERAKIACQNSKLVPQHHFTKMKPTQDYHLTRFACYLTAMNGDPHKKEVAKMQAYFFHKTLEVVE